MKKIEAKYSLRIVPRLSELLGKKIIFVSHTRGKELEEAINKMQPGDVLLVENTRFEDLDGKRNLETIQNLHVIGQV